jgi:SAM-dependent methyltransferase
MSRSATWTRASARHALSFLWQGSNPAATVYDSIGPDFFLALEPGWLNLGLWESTDGEADEAPAAVRRLVRTIAEALPPGGAVLDVGNGLGAQDPTIAEVASPSRLVAVNITRSQLVAGRDRLVEAGARAVNADAARLPLADASFEGVISVEAAFHFSSRRRFFDEAARVLRPGGVLTMSDVPTQRYPRDPLELLAGVTQLRVWGLRADSAARPTDIARMVEGAGFVDVQTQLVGDRVIGPALAHVRRRLEAGLDAPVTYELVCRAMLAQVELLWRNGLIEYLLLRARRP